MPSERLWVKIPGSWTARALGRPAHRPHCRSETNHFDSVARLDKILPFVKSIKGPRFDISLKIIYYTYEENFSQQGSKLNTFCTVTTPDELAKNHPKLSPTHFSSKLTRNRNSRKRLPQI
jgi:hypothetical protein